MIQWLQPIFTQLDLHVNRAHSWDHSFIIIYTYMYIYTSAVTGKILTEKKKKKRQNQCLSSDSCFRVIQRNQSPFLLYSIFDIVKIIYSLKFWLFKLQYIWFQQMCFNVTMILNYISTDITGSRDTVAANHLNIKCLTLIPISPHPLMLQTLQYCKLI